MLLCPDPEDCGEPYLCWIYLCKYLAFSAQGPAAAADLLQGIEGEYLGNEQTPQNNKYVRGFHAFVLYSFNFLRWDSLVEKYRT